MIAVMAGGAMASDNTISTRRPKGRTLAEFLKEGPLSEAEQKLLDACATGATASIADKRPDERTEANCIRGDFVRFLALGGDDGAPVHEHGVRIKGAWIDGAIDLENCRLQTELSFASCTIGDGLILRDATLLALNLGGSAVGDFAGDRLGCAGFLELNSGFRAAGVVKLRDARINGGVDCGNSTFEGTKDGAILLEGAEIKGSLYLGTGFHAKGVVVLTTASISGDLQCEGGQFDGWVTEESEGEGKREKALFADQLKIGGSLFMRAGATTNGAVRFVAARIGGDVDCSNSRFNGTEDGALLLAAVEIRGNVNFGAGFHAKGSVVLDAANVSGNLECKDGEFEGWIARTAHGKRMRGPALSCDQIKIGGSALLGSRFKGGVGLATARIGGNIACDGGTFAGTQDGALLLEGADVKGSVYLSTGFVAKGMVRLSTANIGGNLDCGGGRFDGWITRTKDRSWRRESALFAEQVKIGGSVFFRKTPGRPATRGRFCAAGSVRLTGAKIGGSLICTGARFGGSFVSAMGRFRATEFDDALVCEQVEVGGTVFLNDGFFSMGAVSLRGATIARYLVCTAARFRGGNRGALLCDRAKINGNILLDRPVDEKVPLMRPFHAKRGVSFTGADIAGDLFCQGGRFDSQIDLVGTRIGGDLVFVHTSLRGPLVCNHATVGNILYFLNVNASWAGVRGGENRIPRVDLLATSAATLMDDSASWERVSEIYLDGFRYARIVGNPRTDADRRVVQTTIDAKSRIAWLEKQSLRHRNEDFRPQPWEQLIKTLREMGNAEEAKTIAIEKQNQLRRAGKIARSARFFHAAFGFFAGYGYRPLRLTGYLLGAWLLCGTFFLMVAKQGVMAPTKLRDADQEKYSACRVEMRGNWTSCPILPYEYTTFSPYIYSLDLILPLVGLQQKTDWAPMVRRPCARSIDLIVADFCIEPAPAATAKAQPAVPQAYWPVGVAAWIVMWIEVLLGWIAGILFGAALSVHIKKE
jgi:hypothetical protein